MKPIHVLAVVGLSASLGACIIAPPRPPYVQISTPIATAYVDTAPIVQVLPYVGLGWWAGAHWRNHGNGNGHHHNR